MLAVTYSGNTAPHPRPGWLCCTHTACSKEREDAHKKMKGQHPLSPGQTPLDPPGPADLLQSITPTTTDTSAVSPTMATTAMRTTGLCSLEATVTAGGNRAGHQHVLGQL